jgi:site-specific DNA-methyltransferase (adenine-specific)
MFTEQQMQENMNKIHNIDCLEFMKQVPDNFYDLCLTDPPYGIEIAEWDKDVPSTEYFEEIIRISKNQIIFGGNYFNLPHTNSWICWDRVFAEDVREKAVTRTRVPRENISDFEMIWTSLNIRPSFIRFSSIGNLSGFNNKLSINYNQHKKEHPTQKPLELIDYILRTFIEAKTVIDPFMGSGTTAVACQSLGLEWCGCELEADYVAIANKRLEKVQGSLF